MEFIRRTPGWTKLNAVPRNKIWRTTFGFNRRSMQNVASPKNLRARRSGDGEVLAGHEPSQSRNSEGDGAAGSSASGRPARTSVRNLLAGIVRAGSRHHADG